MAEVKYTKMPSNLFDYNVIKTIADKPDGGETILLYLELLCATAKKRSDTFSVAHAVLDEDVLSNIFDYENIGDKLKTLEEYGLIRREEREIQVFKCWNDPHDRNSVQYKEWRMDVFSRDGFRCVECGTKKDLQAHHIKSWQKHKELRYSVDNGITLCYDCHKKSHGGNWRNVGD